MSRVLHFSSEQDNSREISENGQGRRLSRFRSIRKYVTIKLNKYHDTKGRTKEFSTCSDLDV